MQGRRVTTAAEFRLDDAVLLAAPHKDAAASAIYLLTSHGQADVRRISTGNHFQTYVSNRHVRKACAYRFSRPVASDPHDAADLIANIGLKCPRAAELLPEALVVI